MTKKEVIIKCYLGLKSVPISNMNFYIIYELFTHECIVSFPKTFYFLTNHQLNLTMS